MLGIVRGEIVLGVVGGGVVLGGEEGSCWEGRRGHAGRGGGIVLGGEEGSCWEWWEREWWEEGSCWKGRRGHAGSGGTRRRNEYTIEGRRRCELLVIQLSHTNDAHHPSKNADL